MPRIENDPNVRPFRARITTPGDRTKILPAAEEPDLGHYWKGWLDGHSDARRTIQVVAITCAIAAFIVGALLQAISHSIPIPSLPYIP